jgi:radical SAM superfamily enzyme YgiQ (UPF0313 family)
MTPQLPLIAEEIRIINSKDIIIAGGGPHITGEKNLAEKIGFDILFVSEGEENFLKFGRDLLNKNINKSLKIYSEPNDSSLSLYLPVSKYFRTIPPLELDRGCLGKCKFCSANLKKKSVRTLTSIDEYCRILKNRSYERINFISSSGFELTNLRTIIELVHSYSFKHLEFGIFPSEIHPKSINLNLLQFLKEKVSNNSITIGAQSASEDRLKELKRSSSISNLLETVSLINSSGFGVNLDFIIGYPEETRAEIDRLFDLIHYLRSKYRVKIQLHFFFPLSGSAYAFNKPTFCNKSLRKRLHEAVLNGIISKGWILNELEGKNYFIWLKNFYPEIFKRYR